MPKYNPTKFNQMNFNKMISKEIKFNRPINALLLSHGFVEAYLREWLLYTGDLNKRVLNENDSESYDRISFKNILTVHLVINSFDYPLYKRINELNESRNKFAHEILSVNLNNKQTKRELKKAIKNGLFVCEQIKAGYEKMLKHKEEEAKQMYYDDLYDTRD